MSLLSSLSGKPITWSNFDRLFHNGINTAASGNWQNLDIQTLNYSASSLFSPLLASSVGLTNNSNSSGYSNYSNGNTFVDRLGHSPPRSCPPLAHKPSLGFDQFAMNLMAPSGNNNQYVPPRVRRRQPTCIECVFCKNNGQPESFYSTHVLKDPEGNIRCPVLRNYNCPICNNNGGDKAHTLRYCPRNKPLFWQKKIYKFGQN